MQQSKTQFDEELISRKYLKDQIKVEVESAESLLTQLSQAILKWLTDYEKGLIGSRYNSKDLRLKNFLNPDLVIQTSVAILYSTLIMSSNKLQELTSLVSSQVRICENEWDNIRTVAELLSYVQGVVYNIGLPEPGSFESFTVDKLIEVSTELRQKLSLAMFLPPLKELPENWSNHYDGGYRLSKEYVILGNYFNKHLEYLNLKTINILQSVAYELTSNVNIDEVPNAEWDEEAVQQFKLRQPLTKAIYNEYKDKPFYFMWQYDKRGRLYSKGYDINIQGNEYKKASLRFYKKKKLTSRGIYWLKVDLANSYGLDKLTFSERIEFIDNNIDSMLNSPKEFISKASEPLLFTQALEAYKDGVVNGKEIGHIVRLDATSSGPQIMSVIMRDVKAMRLFNVLGEERNDFYTYVAQCVKDLCPTSTVFPKELKEVRKLMKKPIMTFFYNSKAKPKEILGGEDSKEYQAFIQTLKTSTPGALQLMNTINDCYNPEALYHSWYLPDAHYAYCPVTVVKDKRIELHELNKYAKMSYRYESNEPNKDQWRSLCPNIIHSIDGYIVRFITESLYDKGIELSPIHDSFGVHPNDCDELRLYYRQALSKLYRQNIIDSILSEIKGSKVEVFRPAYDPKIDLEILGNDKGHYIC